MKARQASSESEADAPAQPLVGTGEQVAPSVLAQETLVRGALRRQAIEDFVNVVVKDTTLNATAEFSRPGRGDPDHLPTSPTLLDSLTNEPFSRCRRFSTLSITN